MFQFATDAAPISLETIPTILESYNLVLSLNIFNLRGTLRVRYFVSVNHFRSQTLRHFILFCSFLAFLSERLYFDVCFSRFLYLKFFGMIKFDCLTIGGVPENPKTTRYKVGITSLAIYQHFSYRRVILLLKTFSQLLASTMIEMMGVVGRLGERGRELVLSSGLLGPEL